MGNRRRAGQRAALPDLLATPVEVDITGLGFDGDGLAFHAQTRLYIPFATPGDRVLVQPIAQRSGGFHARIISLIVAGADRRHPPCPRFGVCGGCRLQHLDDSVVTMWKSQRLRAAMAAAGLDPGVVRQTKVVPVDDRRRVALALVPRNGEAILGLRERFRHDVVDITPCLILRPAIAQALPALRAGLAPLAQTGTLDIAINLLDDGLDVLVTGALPSGPEPLAALAKLAEDADLARLSIRPTPGQSPTPVAHRRAGVIHIAGRAVSPPPGSFLQASATAEAWMQALVLEALAGHKHVADLYAGIGTFALALAGPGRQVLAVEGDGAALAALAKAARQVPGMTARQRDLVRDPMGVDELAGFDAVVFDPPQGGAKLLASSLAASTCQRIIAISCDQGSFLRDAGLLAKGGWRMTQLTPIDQFRWSHQIELVAVFDRDGGA